MGQGGARADAGDHLTRSDGGQVPHPVFKPGSWSVDLKGVSVVHREPMGHKFPDVTAGPCPQGAALVGGLDDGRAAGRGGLSLLVLQSIGRLLGLAFVFIVTRQVVPAEFGRLSTVAAIVVLGNFLADFGTSSAMTRLLSRRPADADYLLGGTVASSFVLGLLAYGAVVLFAAASYSSTTVGDIVIGGLAIPSASVLSSLLGALDGVGLIARRAVVSALQTLVVAMGALPVLMGCGVRGALVALAAAPAFSLAVATMILRRAGVWTSRPRIDLRSTRVLLVTALPFALTGGLSTLSMRFDLVLLSLVSNAAETAKYDLALRLLEAGTYISTALTAPLFFLLSRRLAAGDTEGARRAYSEALRVIYLIGLPASVGLLMLASPIVDITLGPGYGAAATPLAIMGAAQWLTWLTYAQGSLIMAGDFVRRGVLVAGMLTGITVALDVILIPNFGSTGAAVAMVVGWALSAALFHRLHRRTVGISTPRPPTRLLLPTGVMALAVLPLRQSTLPIAVAVGATVYAAAVWVCGGITGADRRRLVTMLRRDTS